MADSVMIRMPLLTEERRKEVSKIAKNLAEDAKVSVRNARQESLKVIKKAEDDKSISFEDEGFFYFVNYGSGSRRTFKIGKNYKITIEEI